MTKSFQSGLPGLRVEPGDHICALYFGQAERDKILLPYVLAGLRAGDKCTCLLDDPDPLSAIAELGSSLDIGGVVATGQLEAARSTSTYLHGGRFTAEQMTAHLMAVVDDATGGAGYQFARLACDLTWALTAPPGVAELIDYESEVNRYAPKYPQILLCLYDLERLGGMELVDLLRAHPKLLLGGVVLDNPHFLPPDEMRASRQ
jgi:hypothetical protein